MHLGSCCGFFSSRSSSEVADRDPVLLVSGLAGSILNSKKKILGISYDNRVWVRVFLADLEFRKELWSIYNPDTGYVEPLDKDTEIVVPENDHGLYAIDILDPCLMVKLLRFSEAYHFHDMINMLVGCGYEKGFTLFGYGFDFRQSNRIDKAMKCLEERLEAAHKASGGRKVNIISHSMGGLLVTCFMHLHGDVFSKYVNKWITIATPFQGVAGCVNDALLTGMQFFNGFESNFFISRWTMHQLVVECPSIYEMLPNPGFKWEKQPKIQVWRKKSKNEKSSVVLESYGPRDSPRLFDEALKNNELNYGGRTFPLPFNFSILKWAEGTREILNNAQLPEGILFYNIYGTSYGTPYDVCYGSETNPITDISDVCHTMPKYSFVNGDGTVPAESAQGDNFKAVERVGIDGSHRGLLCDKKVFEFIQNWLGVTPKVKKLHNKTSKVTDSISSKLLPSEEASSC